jgi:hypothetical protein
MSSISEIYDQAIQLSPDEQLELADRLWRRAWQQEIQSRLDRLDRGETQLIDWDEAIAEIRKSVSPGDAQ